MGKFRNALAERRIGQDAETAPRSLYDGPLGKSYGPRDRSRMISNHLEHATMLHSAAKRHVEGGRMAAAKHTYEAAGAHTHAALMHHYAKSDDDETISSAYNASKKAGELSKVADQHVVPISKEPFKR